MEAQDLLIQFAKEVLEGKWEIYAIEERFGGGLPDRTFKAYRRVGLIKQTVEIEQTSPTDPQ